MTRPIQLSALVLGLVTSANLAQLGITSRAADPIKFARYANIANDVFIDRTTDQTPIAYEAISGPIATNTYKHEILNSFPTNGESLVNSLQAVLSLQGVECRAIDTYSYQLVEVNAGAGTMTISSRDQNGHVLSDDLNPATKCTKTLGP